MTKRFTSTSVPDHCHNCGAAVEHSFCAVCGQETRLHVPSAVEFFHEFIGHYVALEGKLWQTLWLLVLRPGRLSADYIAGRRARYVQPLRLYLSLSILFFALLKYGPQPLVQGDGPADDKASATATATATAAARVPGAPTEADEPQFSTKLGEFSPALQTRIDQLTAMPKGDAAKVLKNAIFNYVPYAMFCMMPVFALYLKLLYLGSGRRYGEHMLFALHSNAFAFLMLGLIWVSPWGWASVLLFTWLVAYLPLAMRRVYGGSWWATALRVVLLMITYLASMASAIVGAVATGLVISS
jgi:hypothetical protein